MIKILRIYFILAALLAVSACSSFDADDYLDNHPRDNSNDPGGSTYFVSMFVSALGNNTNSGLTNVSPLLSLQAAVDLAKACKYKVCIYISGNLAMTNLTNGAGAYFSGMTNLTLSGGWDSDFTSQSNESVLDGAGVATNVIQITKSSGLVFTNLSIAGGGFTNSTSFGGGIYIADSAGCTINCTVSGNKGCNGGGIFMTNSRDNIISGIIASNFAATNGGGIYLVSSTNNQISGTFVSNYASSVAYGGSGGGIYAYSSYSNRISGTYLNNYAGYGGGGIYFRLSFYNRFDGTVTGNTAEISAGGLCLDSSAYNTTSGTFCYNLARSYGGGGMMIQGGGYNTVSGTFISNNAASGGGFYFYWTTCNRLSGNITGNSAHDKGGGLCLEGATSNTIASGFVIRYNHCDTDNLGSFTGGGIYSTNSTGNIIEAGCITNPNYLGSGTNTIDNIAGSY